MKPLGSARGVWALVLTLGMVVASCATQALTPDLRPPAPDLRPLTSTEPDSATKAKVQAIYGRLPLHFEPNQGQTDEQVEFLSRGSGCTLFLTSTEAVLALTETRRHGDAETRRHGEVGTVAISSPRPRFGGEGEGGGAVLRMQLVGANPNPQVAGLDELASKVNYFLGNDPKKWHTNIPTYAKVKYLDVYPGVDLVYYGNQRQLEHDFIVSPGADPRAITLAFEGADKVEIAAQGDLILHTAGGELRLHKPRIYQEINGVKQAIPGRYVLLGLGTRDSGLSKVGFHVAAYDTSKPLIIDPVLSYSTYLGGSGGDRGEAITVDSSGNVYVTGQTSSTDFPTKNPFQATLSGGNFSDAFVTKLNAAGSALVYSTYLGGSDVGGSGSDVGSDIAVDSSGNAYVTGFAYSTDFPVTAGAFQTTKSGGYDVFVTKLNPTGSALVGCN